MHQHLVRGLGYVLMGRIDRHEARRVERGRNLAMRRQEEGMEAIGQAQDDAIDKICTIEEHLEVTTGRPASLGC